MARLAVNFLQMEHVKEFEKVAIGLAVEAATIISEASKLKKNVLTKENQADLVTETDKKVEAFLFKKLGQIYPDHVLIGEETQSAGDGRIGELSDSPTWIIDPVDGTTNFVHSFPFYCISIGLAVDKKPAVGVVYNVQLGQLFYASSGNGAFIKEASLPSLMQSAVPTRLSCSTALPKSLGESLILTEFGASKDQAILLAKLKAMERIMSLPVGGRGIRSLGSAALNMCTIAQGYADVYYECN